MKSFFYIITFITYFFTSSSFSQGNQWVWMKGDKLFLSADYGTKGVPGINNKPGGRYEPAEWTDLDGNFWLFGGRGFDDVGATIGNLNDLWRFNPKTKEWTWMHGSKLRNDNTIAYGTLGVAAPNNRPMARAYASLTWVDKKGNLWLYGGISGSQMNDLWKYTLEPSSPDIYLWMWMGGNSFSGRAAVYGKKGIPDPANSPGGRSETSCSWVDNDGYFWLFGGQSPR